MKPLHPTRLLILAALLPRARQNPTPHSTLPPRSRILSDSTRPVLLLLLPAPSAEQSPLPPLVFITQIGLVYLKASKTAQNPPIILPPRPSAMSATPVVAQSTLLTRATPISSRMTPCLTSAGQNPSAPSPASLAHLAWKQLPFVQHQWEIFA